MKNNKLKKVCEFCNNKGYNLQDDNIPCLECNIAKTRKMF